MTSKAGIPCVVLALAIACSKTEETSSSSAGQTCDPLTVGAEPTRIGELVAAGRAADGTVFVVDRGDRFRGLRAFVSDGSTLRRRQISGSGEGPDFVIASLEGGIEVRIELASGTATRMGIARGALDPNSKSFDIATQGEELVLMSANELSGFQLANIQSIDISYAATTADGHRFYVFEPKVDRTDDAMRAFYGTPERMVERRVLSVSRSSALHVEIDLEGVRTMAVLTFCITGNAFGAPRLQPEGGPAIALTPVAGSPGGVTCSHLFDAGTDAGAEADAPVEPVDAATLTAGLRFVCF